MTNQTVIHVKSIRELMSLKGQDGAAYCTAGYHDDGMGCGAATYVWDELSSKSKHDGFLHIDPSRKFPDNWTRNDQRQEWYKSDALARSTGCFVLRVSLHLTTVDQAGAKPYTAKQDDSESVQKCNDSLSGCNEFSTIRLGSGNYKFNISLTGDLIGSGNETRVVPADPSRACVTANTDVGWVWRRIANLRFKGSDRQGDFFTYAMGKEFRKVGRYTFSHVTAENCNAFVRKPSGNIGGRYDCCTVSNSNYFLWATCVPRDKQTKEFMNTGNDTFFKCHAGPNIGKACYRYETSSEAASELDLVFVSCLHQRNQGFTLLVEGGAMAGIATGSISIVGGWIEQSPLIDASPVKIGKVEKTPFAFDLTNVRNMRIQGLLVESIKLTNSSVELDYCQQSDIAGASLSRVEIDSDSSITSANDNSQFKRNASVLVESWGTPHATSRGGAWIPFRTGKVFCASSQNGISVSFAGTNPFHSLGYEESVQIGSTQIEDGVLFPNCAEFKLTKESFAFLTKPITLTPGMYVFASVHLRTTEGETWLSMSYPNGQFLTMEFPSTDNNWRCFGTLARVKDSGENQVSLKVRSPKGGKFRVADFQLIQFVNLRDAVAYSKSLAYFVHNTD